MTYNRPINILTAGSEVDEESFVKELNKVVSKIGEKVKNRRKENERTINQQLRAEMDRLRPQAKRLLTGDE